MNLKALVTAPARGVRSLTRMIFTRQTFRWVWRGHHGSFDYLSEVGNGMGSSTVAAPVLWVARTFPEAPPALWKVLANGQEEPVRRHPLLDLLQKPNGFYTGLILWMATVVDWIVDGNAYWIIVRSRAGDPVELWWCPCWMLEPIGDEKSLVTHYIMRIDGQETLLPAADVVHFRFGLDPDDQRKGFSPLKSVLREVFTDDQAAQFTASLLRNMGVPGLVVSPEKGDTQPSVDDVKETKEWIKEAFSGERRGEPLVMSGPTKIEQFGFSPDELTLRELRRIPEERVTAVTGIPAIVAGLGAGLDRSTFTNMGEAREAAYEAGIIPMQRILAEEIRFQLLEQFGEDPFEFRFGFDLSKVRVLQEDLYRQAQRHDLGIRGGWVTVLEGRRALGLETTGGDDVFLRPLNVQKVSRNGEIAGGAAAVNGNGAANGRVAGHHDGFLAAEVAGEVIRAIEQRELAQPAR